LKEKSELENKINGLEGDASKLQSELETTALTLGASTSSLASEKDQLAQDNENLKTLNAHTIQKLKDFQDQLKTEREKLEKLTADHEEEEKALNA
jgi:molybdopterin converting factor small subunit